MDVKRLLANNIYILRQKLGLTQQEFVDKLDIGLSRGHLSNIENGNHMPSAEFIKAVADTFKVDTNWILSSHNTDYPDISLTSDEIEVILKLRKLPERIAADFIELLEYMSK